MSRYPRVVKRDSVQWKSLVLSGVWFSRKGCRAAKSSARDGSERGEKDAIWKVSGPTMRGPARAGGFPRDGAAPASAQAIGARPPSLETAKATERRRMWILSWCQR